eukprot:g6947.t1
MQDGPWIVATVVALFAVLFMPTLAQLFGFAPDLQRMSDEVARRYGLDLEAMRAHDFEVDESDSALLVEAECPICLETGHHAWSVLLSHTSRGCGHFFCSRCARGLLATSRTCAICRAPFARLASLPDPHDEPRAWFALVDMDGSGDLSKTEVLNVLRLLFPAEHASGALARELDDVWGAWDVQLSGGVTMERAMDPEHGLLAYFTRKKAAQSSSARADPGQ